jgi:hypothetical protein
MNLEMIGTLLRCHPLFRLAGDNRRLFTSQLTGNQTDRFHGSAAFDESPTIQASLWIIAVVGPERAMPPGPQQRGGYSSTIDFIVNT